MLTDNDIVLAHISLSDSEESKYGRRRDLDGSIRPSRDTGFRMPPQPEFKYARRNVVVDTRPFVEFVHNDDIKDIGQGTLRGQPLTGVRVYSIDYDAVEQRAVNLLAGAGAGVVH